MSLTERISDIHLSDQEYNKCTAILRNWLVLSEKITQIQMEKYLLWLIKAELRGKKRPEIVFRIHSRLNTVRRTNERKELMALLNQ